MNTLNDTCNISKQNLEALSKLEEDMCNQKKMFIKLKKKLIEISSALRENEVYRKTDFASQYEILIEARVNIFKEITENLAFLEEEMSQFQILLLEREMSLSELRTKFTDTLTPKGRSSIPKESHATLLRGLNILTEYLLSHKSEINGFIDRSEKC